MECKISMKGLRPTLHISMNDLQLVQEGNGATHSQHRFNDLNARRKHHNRCLTHPYSDLDTLLHVEWKRSSGKRKIEPQIGVRR